MPLRNAINTIAVALAFIAALLAALPAQAQSPEVLHVLQGLPDREMGEMIADYNFSKQNAFNRIALISEELAANIAANDEKQRQWKDACSGVGTLNPVQSLRCKDLEEEGRQIRAKGYELKAEVISAYVASVNEGNGIDDVVRHVLTKSQRERAVATAKFDEGSTRSRSDLFDGKGADEQARAEAKSISDDFAAGLAEALDAEGVGGNDGSDWILALAYDEAVQRMAVSDLILVAEGYRTLSALVAAGPVGFAPWDSVLGLLGGKLEVWGSRVADRDTITVGSKASKGYDRDNTNSRR